MVRRQGAHPYSHDVTIVKKNAIHAVLESKPPTGEEEETLPAVDHQRMQEKEERAVKAAEIEATKIGIGVSEEGQRLFDAISKTLPARWNGKDIVVLEEVRMDVSMHLFCCLCQKVIEQGLFAV